MCNQGFHEAVGDVLTLSVNTPKHLASIGLLPNQVDDQGNCFYSKLADVMTCCTAEINGIMTYYATTYNNVADLDITYLLAQALRKLAFIPFGYLMDQWRWKVFIGAVSRDQYNAEWNELV